MAWDKICKEMCLELTDKWVIFKYSMFWASEKFDWETTKIVNVNVYKWFGQLVIFVWLRKWCNEGSNCAVCKSLTFIWHCIPIYIYFFHMTLYTNLHLSLSYDIVYQCTSITFIWHCIPILYTPITFIWHCIPILYTPITFIWHCIPIYIYYFHMTLYTNVRLSLSYDIVYQYYIHLSLSHDIVYQSTSITFIWHCIPIYIYCFHMTLYTNIHLSLSYDIVYQYTYITFIWYSFGRLSK